MASPARDPIPITVIGGYLGAGKTTLINRLLRGADGRSLGVIVNDFGSIGIDAELLTAAAGDGGVVNLPNGCVCCTLGGDLFETLTMLRDRVDPPEHIVIEASGVADPAVAAGWGTSAGFVPGGVVVLAGADSIPTQVRDKYVGGEVRRQLAGADIVVLTKLDLCTAAQADAARSIVAALAGAAPVEGGDVPTDVVLGLRPSTVAGGSATRHDERYARWAWTGGTLAPHLVTNLLADLIAVPPAGLLRLKGWIDTGEGHLIVQAVGPTITSAPAMSDTPGTRLEAVGVSGRFDPAALTARLDAASG